MSQKPKTKTIDMSIEEKSPKEAPQMEQKDKKTEKKITVARPRGKKYNEKKVLVNRDNLYQISEAVTLVKQTSYSKFDGTVELHMAVKKEGINVNVSLPFSTGKAKRIEIADESTIAKLKEGKADFDVLLATADMMPKLVAFARILGPKGLMPNPKNGTIIKDASQATKFSGNTINVKTEKKAQVIHTIAGKVSQESNEIEANVNAILDTVGRRQIVKAYIKPTMGPSVKLQVN